MRRLRATVATESTMHTYHSIVMDTFDTVCNVKTKVGGRYIKGCYVMDGQKYVCMDDLMEDIRNEKCIIYSFGIGHDWSFEDNLAKMGCEVFAYDPTIEIKDALNHSAIKFKSIGLKGDPNIEDIYYKSLSTILEENGHLDTEISYLKLDIEAHELTGIPIWLKTGSLDNVQQIGMEVHLEPPTQNVTLEFLQTFKDLQLQGRFRIFNWEANNCWKNLNKKYRYFGLSEIVLKKVDPTNSCIQ